MLIKMTPCNSGTVELLLWQYCTISEKSRLNADRDTSCFPRLSDLSKMLVFGLITGVGVGLKCATPDLFNSDIITDQIVKCENWFFHQSESAFEY